MDLFSGVNHIPSSSNDDSLWKLCQGQTLIRGDSPFLQTDIRIQFRLQLQQGNNKSRAYQVLPLLLT